MSFLYPSFLYGLGLMAIPVIIHYFNLQRAKRVYFTNVSFLKTVKDVTNARNRLKHLLVMIARMLFIGFLCVAFAQPYFPKEIDVARTAETAYVSIYFDNSYSMQSEFGERRLFDIAQNTIEQITKLFPTKTLFQVVDNRFEEEIFLFSDGEKVLDKMGEMTFSNVGRRLEEVFMRQKDALRTNTRSLGGHSIFWITDFQKSTIGNLKELPFDSINQFYLLPLLPNQTSNVYIDSVWLPEPFVKESENNVLNIRVLNEGEEEAKSRTLKFFIEEKMVASTTLNIPSKNAQTIQLNFSTDDKGLKKCRLQIEDFAVSFDDEYFFQLKVAPTIKIILIGNGNEYFIEEVFKGESFFRVEKYDFQAIDFNALKEADLLIIQNLVEIDDALKSSLTEVFLRGVNVMIFPAPDVETNSLAETFGLNVRKLEVGSQLPISYQSFKAPFFEKIFDKIEANMSVPQASPVIEWAALGQDLLKLRNDKAFMSLIPQKRGKLYLSSSPLMDGYTDFHKHALFLPVMYRIALASKSGEERLAYNFSELTANILLDSVSRNDIFKLVNGESELIPQQRIMGNNLQISIPKGSMKAGIYDIRKTSNNQWAGSIAINYDKKESQLAHYTLDELKSAIEGRKNVQVFEANEEDKFAKNYQEQNLNSTLWRIFLIIALLFLMIESMLIRFWKTT